MSGKRINAHITIMAALSMTIVLSLISACIKSASDCYYNTQIKEACMLSVEAAFSSYHNDMLNEYDIFLLEDTDRIEAKIEKYVEKNLSSCGKDISLLGINVDNIEHMTDKGGIYLKKEIARYMQYEIYGDMFGISQQSQAELEKSQKVQEITQDITECEEMMWEADVKTLRLIELVDGIETTETGIVIRRGKPVAVFDYFVKSAVNGMVSKEALYVDEDKVYKSVSVSQPGYVDVSKILDDMYEDAEGITEDMKDSGDVSSYADFYKRNYDMLKAVIEGADSKTEEALKLLGEYENAKTGAKDKLGKCVEKVKLHRNILGDELQKGLLEDIEVIRQDNESDKKMLCNIKEVTAALKRNKIILDGVKDIINELDTDLSYNNRQKIMGIVIKCRESLYGLSAKGMKFDYSQIDFDSDSSGLSAIKKVRQMITDGILALVMDTDNISEKTITYGDLATSMSEKYKENISAVDAIKEDALMNEYLMTRFKCYTDYLEESANDAECLDYTLEYILCGGDSDKENLEQTMLALSGIRTGMNMAYLITDQNKKAQALTLATSALGFTGNMALIKGGQYLIMSIWAYGEAVMDMRDIYAGKKVKLLKNSQSWKLSLEGLLNMTFDTDKETDDEGLDYKDYIRMLLLMESAEHRNYRTMGAMELRMISMGHENFRMKNYVVSAKGEAVFRISGRKQVYVQEMGCSYI